mmetsp:Transcript_105942/g.326989  ORF Transcript_105942/g.326989 Transcript_105942/m.326989 type:complete len:426 (-) Transcript_105942:564-1841(-)
MGAGTYAWYAHSAHARMRASARLGDASRACARGRRTGVVRSSGPFGAQARRTPLQDLVGDRVEHGAENNDGVDASHAVALLAHLAGPDVGHARGDPLEHVVDADGDGRLRGLRQHPAVPAPGERLDLLHGVGPSSLVVGEPLAHGLVRGVRLLVVADVAPVVDAREARVEAVHDRASDHEAAGLQVDAVHPLLHVDAVVRVSRLRGQRVQGLGELPSSLRHLHVQAFVAVAQLHHAALAAVAGYPVRVQRAGVTIIGAPLRLKAQQRVEGLLGGLLGVQNNEALGHPSGEGHVVPWHQAQTRHPVLAGQDPPQLRVVRPAGDDAARLHARHHLEEGVGVHVRRGARHLVAVGLLALYGPQEVQRDDGPAAAEGRQELGRDARELVAVLDEDGEHLVVPAEPRHHGAVEEELDEPRGDRGALGPPP